MPISAAANLEPNPLRAAMRPTVRSRAGLIVLLAGACFALTAPRAMAQDAPPDAPPGPAPESVEPTGPDARAAATEPDPGESEYDGRPIAALRFEGLNRVEESLVRNQVRSLEGTPLNWRILRDDLRRLERLGQFRGGSTAEIAVNPDRSVTVIFRMVEAPIIRSIQVAGNRQISDGDLNAATRLQENVPIDDYQIGAAQRAIEQLYRDRGYFQVQVLVDESELEQDGVLLFRIREGERIKVTGIRFEGNNAFRDGQLRPQIDTKTASLLQKAPLKDEVLDADIGALTRFYEDRGYLDVRVSRQIQPSPNNKEAIVTFVIEEGPIYTLRSVIVRNAAGDDDQDTLPLSVFTPEQIRALMPLKPGDAFGRKPATDAAKAVRDAYWRDGYADADVQFDELRAIDSPQVDMLLTISEGARFRTGAIIIQGNDLTKQRVIRRELTLKPDRPLDRTELEQSEQALVETRLFKPNTNPLDPGVKTTVQPEDPAYPGYRDVLVEVQESNTGSFTFGAAVDSDGGLLGQFTLRQRNFDAGDFPESFDEFIRGRAFRGAGQDFQITAAPGTELSRYGISLSEPSLWDSDYSGSVSGYYNEREYTVYDEERLGGRFAVGRRFGTRWTARVSARAESIDISNIERSSPVDVFEVEGENTLTSVGLGATRSTVDSRFRPTEGTRTEIEVEQFGLIGGDFDFTRISTEYTLFIPVYEDFLGRRDVLSLKLRSGYIPQEGEAPLFERYYLGGRSFRGFDFRGVSPIGIRNDTGELGDDPVGGEWMFFAGVEYEKPLFEELISIVGFVDSGTVQNDVSFDLYRVSVGVGLRIYLEMFSQAPLAFDFGFPIVKEDFDDEELFSFSIDIPF